MKIQAVDIHHSHFSGSQTFLIEIPDKQFIRPDIQTPHEIIKNTTAQQRTANRLCRTNKGKSNSKKYHQKTRKTKTRTPETLLVHKTEATGTRMIPMTRSQKYQDKQTLCYWIATTENPFTEAPDIDFPSTKLPMRYGYTKINSRKKTNRISTLTRETERYIKHVQQETPTEPTKYIYTVSVRPHSIRIINPESAKSHTVPFIMFDVVSQEEQKVK